MVTLIQLWNQHSYKNPYIYLISSCKETHVNHSNMKSKQINCISLISSCKETWYDKTHFNMKLTKSTLTCHTVWSGVEWEQVRCVVRVWASLQHPVAAAAAAAACWPSPRRAKTSCSGCPENCAPPVLSQKVVGFWDSQWFHSQRSQLMWGTSGCPSSSCHYPL